MRPSSVASGVASSLDMDYCRRKTINSHAAMATPPQSSNFLTMGAAEPEQSASNSGSVSMLRRRANSMSDGVFVAGRTLPEPSVCSSDRVIRAPKRTLIIGLPENAVFADSTIPRLREKPFLSNERYKP